MKKLQIFIISILIIVIGSDNDLKGVLGEQGVGGYELNQINSDGTSTGSTNGSCSASGGTCCKQGSTCCPNGCNTASSFPIPPFIVQILDQSGNILNKSTTNPNGKVLNTNNISVATSILIVQIFPPSNTISGSSVTFLNQTSGNNYIIMYTLKDPSGSVVYVDYDLIPASSPVPAAINIPAIGSSASTASQATISASTGTSYAANVSLFSNSITTAANQLTILNGISPMTQKFLFTANPNTDQTTTNQSAGSFSITPISGIYDSERSQSYISPQGFFTTSAAGTTFAISISFDGSTPFLSFTGTNITFNAQDLANGLILTTTIYPSNSGNNYRVIATLKTIDGLKYRKQYALNSSSGIQPYTSMPTSIYLLDGNKQQLFSTTFFNSTITNATTPFNIIAPINIRFLIMKPATSATIMYSLL